MPFQMQLITHPLLPDTLYSFEIVGPPQSKPYKPSHGYGLYFGSVVFGSSCLKFVATSLQLANEESSGMGIQCLNLRSEILINTPMPFQMQLHH